MAIILPRKIVFDHNYAVRLLYDLDCDVVNIRHSVLNL